VGTPRCQHTDPAEQLALSGPNSTQARPKPDATSVDAQHAQVTRDLHGPRGRFASDLAWPNVHGLLAADSPSFVEQFWPVLAAGVFGVGGGLGGVLIGRTLERRHGFEAWRRDHRLAAYSDVFGRASTYWLLASRIYYRPHERDDDQVEDLHARMFAFEEGLARVALLGPDEAWRQAAALHKVLQEIDDLVTADEIGNTTPLAESGLAQKYSQQVSSYLEAAQRGIVSRGDDRADRYAGPDTQNRSQT
jgi:hypothetical protein